MPRPHTQPDRARLVMNQQTAAMLLGISPRALRDAADAPRRDDGNYDGPAIVSWWRSKLDPPELSDADHERMLTGAELLYSGAVDGAEALGLIDMLGDLRAKYGEAAWAEFVGHLVTLWREAWESQRAELLALTPAAEVRRRLDAELLRESERLNRAALRVAVVCERCRKLRRGPRWVRNDPPADHTVELGRCPAC